MVFCVARSWYEVLSVDDSWINARFDSPRTSFWASHPRMALDFAVSYCKYTLACLSVFYLSTEHWWYSGWDIHDAVYSRELLISNKANGYKDIIASIDLSTYRRIPWEDYMPFFLVSFLDPDTKEPLCVCPRQTLRKASEQARLNGWECVAGVEYEVQFRSLQTV